MSSFPRRSAIILCGGKSSRMRRDKATLPFGPDETNLQRVARLLGCVVDSKAIVCVAAPGQDLPSLPDWLEIVFDAAPEQGPLAGMAWGLNAIAERADKTFLIGSDAPLLKPAFVDRMFELVGNHEIAAVHDGGSWHPLGAVYRTDLSRRVNELLDSGERSLTALLELSHTRRVDVEDLRDVDAQLDSLARCNTPEEYQRLLKAAGYR